MLRCARWVSTGMAGHVATHLPGLQHADELHGDLGKGWALVGTVAPALPHQLIPGGRECVCMGWGGQKGCSWEMGRSEQETKAWREGMGLFLQLWCTGDQDRLPEAIKNSHT